MSLVVEESDKKIEFKKTNNQSMEKVITGQDVDSPKKLNSITKTLKKGLHDFWYGWVMID